MSFLRSLFAHPLLALLACVLGSSSVQAIPAQRNHGHSDEGSSRLICPVDLAEPLHGGFAGLIKDIAGIVLNARQGVPRQCIVGVSSQYAFYPAVHLLPRLMLALAG